METAAPIIVGCVCGLLGGAPYVVALAYSRRTHSLGILPGLAAVAISVLVFAGSLLGAWALARASVLPFAVALVIAFFFVVIIGAVWFMRKPRP